MLAKAGLVEGDRLQECCSTASIRSRTEAAGHRRAARCTRANEPGQLDGPGVKYNLFDPTEADIPGIFGVIYTNAKASWDEHPTAAPGLHAGHA